jgi:tagatose 1,6-diphosphate aldolase GatY/KbaY
MKSVMADGSEFTFNENLEWTKSIVSKAHAYGAVVEAELGRISGTEDGITVEEFQAKLTDPNEAYEFVNMTGIDSLAICIGNVHGKYPGIPNLDFQLLKEIRKKVDLPLVLHGASGLPPKLVRKSIQLGVCKFNVNTEVREAYINFFAEYPKGAYSSSELLNIMKGVTDSMMEIVIEKIKLLGSSSRS